MKYIFLIYFLACSTISSATIRLPAIFGNNMVIQQRSWVKFWGWGSPGEKIKISTTWDNLVDSATVDGNARFEVNIKTSVAGGPYSIMIKGSNTIELKNVLVGEVWVCSGQSNMEFSYNWGAPAMKTDVSKAAEPAIRFFTVQKTTSLYPQDDVLGEWKICDSNTVKSFSAVAYYFGKKLNEDLNVPIGLINASWGGTPAEVWTPAEIVNRDSTLARASQKLNSSPWWPVTPGYTYNAMIAPLTNFSIAGATWYQGESNTGTASTYAKLLTSMIESWRTKWNKDLPFYFVQIAPYAYGNRNIAALLREAQTKVSTLHNTGMVVITDLVDDTADIHPKNKKDVGFRLAKMALVKTYHTPVRAALSPMYNSMRVDKNQVFVAIENSGTGLIQDGKMAIGFEVAGDDHRFYPALARISGSAIIVSNADVQHPIAVRYAFNNTAVGNIFTREGLPLGPFRTDDWPVDTAAIK
jgi:sialate O-acetylesterase